MSQPAPMGGQPTSFKTNVNRAKTKRWVEAKSYSYDGDDWGDVDDYDEYGGYDEPEPPPAPKPTGLRQRGQSATQSPQEGYGARPDLYQSPIDTRQTYGNMAGPAPQHPQQYGGRSVTDPQPQHHPALVRQNSFDPEEERRAFSSDAPIKSMTNAGVATNPSSPLQKGQNLAANDFGPGQSYVNQAGQAQPGPGRPPLRIQNQSSVGDEPRHGEKAHSPVGNYRGVSYSDQPRKLSMGSRSQSMTSNISTPDIHNRRDFSPSAMPPPLQTRGSPSPHANSGSSSRHPPRKSSMTQENVPTLPYPTQASPMLAKRDIEDDFAPNRDRSGSSTDKALPFVRPADIYRRLHEEREKERQSQESSRPSMEAILAKSTERPSLEKPRDSESAQQLMPTLDPLTERKSEYGMEGTNLNNQGVTDELRPTTSKRFELPKHSSNSEPQDTRSSLRPMLPDVSRISGFGESFFGMTDTSDEPSQPPLPNFAGSTSLPTNQTSTERAPERDLRNQPSLGFTSAVHQAFEKAEEQVPPTPSSAAGSTVGRSTSGGTSVVSPIISRGPSTAKENWNSTLPGIEDVTTPTKAVYPGGSSSRPMSSDSLGTPKQISRKPSPSQAMRPPSTEELPPSFIPGYRRNSNTPSPDNSPARTPALEVNRQLRQPQEVEIDAMTPTDIGFSTGSSSRESEATPEESPIAAQMSEEMSGGRHDAALDTQAVATSLAGKADSTGSPSTLSPAHDYLRNRTDSSGSGRVRNLADRFESGSRPGSAHSTTPRASVATPNLQRREDLVPPRPLADRMESFRPHIPGGWESSASIASAAAFSKAEMPRGISQQEQTFNLAHDPNFSNDRKEVHEDTAVSHTDEPLTTTSQVKDASEEAFAAVTAAGAALAGAFGAAIGMEHHDPGTKSTAETLSGGEPQQRKFENNGAATRDRTASVNTVIHPDASKLMPNFTDDDVSTAAHTPVSKDTTHGPSKSLETPECFANTAQKQESKSASEPVHVPTSVRQPPTLPMLTTDTKPHQYESDRLRREIARQLSPLPDSGTLSSEPTTAESDYSRYHDASRTETNPSVTRPGHESGVLPREYESYWNDAESDIGSSEFSGEPGQVEDATTANRQQGAVVIGEPLHPVKTMERASPAAINQAEPTQDRPQMLPHRFSWEQPLANVSVEPEPVQEAAQEPVATPQPNFLKSAIYPEGESFQPQEELQDLSKAAETSMIPMTIRQVAEDSPTLPDKDFLNSEPVIPAGYLRPTSASQNESPSYPGGLEVAQPPAEKQSIDPVEPGYTDDKTGVGYESPRLQDHVQHDLEPPRETIFTTPTRGHEPPPTPPPLQTSWTPPGQDGDLPPMPPAANAQPKIPAFREILALKNPSDRIRAYNETREQFANLNYGLAHWLAITANSLPEHADLLTSFGRPAPSFQGHARSKSKLGGLLPGGVSNQQPYFQQYLNASPSAPVAGGGSLSGLGGGLSPGFSPSGGSGSKISSQQVQAKGKDFVRSAGVFGGKANVAAKGLFSKGKSKLRAASGAEKASTPPYSPNRGMQPQAPSQPSEPQPYAQPATGPVLELQTSSDRSLSHPPPKPQYTIQDLTSRSPRDTPSLESVTQSQLGDDERSEGSGHASREHPPRSSSHYKNSRARDKREDHTIQNPVMIGDSAPIFLQQTPSAKSYIGSPKEIHTPRSTTSSNKTPTQANFTEAGQHTSAQGLPDAIEKTFFQDEAGEGDGEHQAGETTGQYPSLSSPPQSRFSTQVQQYKEDRARMLANQDAFEQDVSQSVSEESDGTFPTAGSSRNPPNTSSLPSESPKNQKSGIGSNLQASVFNNTPPVSPSSPPFSQPHTSGNDLVRNRLLATNNNAHSRLRASQDYSFRPSMEGMPDRIDPDRPPSPISPQRSITHEVQRGRAAPVHYGIDHDFVPESDQERARSRSRSIPRTHHSRHPSDISRSSIDPNIHEHPAFRSISPASEGTDIPTEHYPGQVPRDESDIPRQQGIEHQLEGRAPPSSEGKPRSRRGSRSSAFLKSLGSGSKLDSTPMPNTHNNQPSSPPVTSPSGGEKRRRASVFRSLTGNSGSGSGSVQSKENIAPRASAPQWVQSPQPASATPQQAKDNSPSRGVSNKFSSKKLQRASTSGNTEKDGGKKKRFSVMGSLFGRSNQKRQSQTEQRQAPSQQGPPAQQQIRAAYNPSSPQNRQSAGRNLLEGNSTQPPPGGYYAPTRSDFESNQAFVDYKMSNQRPRGPADAPAYVQDSAIRQRVADRMSPPSQAPTSGAPRPLATLPQNSPGHSSSTVPRSDTYPRSMIREPFPQRPSHESQPSGNSWTRFSQHGRSKSRQSENVPPLKDRISPPQPNAYIAPPPLNLPRPTQQLFEEPSRSGSPPPPPPPPKDEWHRPRARDSTSNPTPSTRSNQALPTSQPSIRPVSTQQRQSLPPLQTDVAGSARNSTIRSDKTLTPEEKRRSRQQEIEQSTLSPQSPAGAGARGVPGNLTEEGGEGQGDGEGEGEEEIVMSATSFPGHVWEPSFAVWEGD